jgi:hypothetical protein
MIMVAQRENAQVIGTAIFGIEGGTGHKVIVAMVVTIWINVIRASGNKLIK